MKFLGTGFLLMIMKELRKIWRLQIICKRLFFVLFYERRTRMSAVMATDAIQKGIICSFRRFPHSRGDGYYEIRTEQGEFLSNVDRAELTEELRDYREQGYTLSKIKGG